MTPTEPIGSETTRGGTISRVLIVDTICPKPYSPETLRDEGLGGSEASIVRVAERLGSTLSLSGGEIVVVQRGRTEPERFHALYAPMTPEVLAGRWHAVVVFRAPGALADVESFAPGARKLLWLQDLADIRLANQSIPRVDPVIVVLSRFHADNIRRQLAQFHPGFTPRVVEIPNPVDEGLIPDHCPVDRSRLIFFSSPNKGLRHTLAVFRRIRQADPAFTLGIANPGYKDLDIARLPTGGVFFLGVLPHHRVIEHVRRSLCVLALNHVYPETFGCVFAEANAVGTPVLTHPHGAAPEVLDDQSQLLDVRDSGAVVARITEWRDGARPMVGPAVRFRTERVAERWRELLQT